MSGTFIPVSLCSPGDWSELGPAEFQAVGYGYDGFGTYGYGSVPNAELDEPFGTPTFVPVVLCSPGSWATPGPFA